jgi:hypothetical protein
VSDELLAVLLACVVLGFVAWLGIAAVDALNRQSQLQTAGASPEYQDSEVARPQTVAQSGEAPLLGTWEYTLACIDAGYHLPQDDLSVLRFRYLLKSLESKTYNTEAEISDMTLKARDILREEYGIDETVLSLMEEANYSIPPGMRMKYQEVLAALLVLKGAS